MTSSRLSDTRLPLPTVLPGASLLSRLARRAVLTKMAHLQQGLIEIHENGQVARFGTVTSAFPRPVVVTITDPAFYADIAFGGSVGAGESWILGRWHCDRLVDLIRIMACNRDLIDAVEGGSGRLTAPLNKLFHWLHRNSRAGSRRNIQAHYDLGNDFFKLFLDDTMMYSAGIFPTPEATMKEASLAKLDRICRKLELGPEDHVLEIGTGWGGFAIHAARHYGCRVTTTTISKAQYELARQRVAEAGLEDRIELLLEDYRDLQGQYDKLVSIEMIEAIGEANIGSFFDVCHQRLKPEGKMVLQAITIADRLYPEYRRSVDFIQRYVFPGGFLPSVGSLCRDMARHSDLQMVHMEDIGIHYATTLNRWRQALMANLDAVRNLGYSREFIRLWEFYLCYCEGGFLERTIGTAQMVLAKSDDRTAPLLGDLG